MTASLGRITAQLADPVVDISPELVDLIKANVAPPGDLAPEDVFIRAMYIVSTEVNSYGGCFPVDEHERLASLLPDSPVMIGHRRDKLPVARTFFATTVLRDGEPWVKSYFYWLKSAEGAENLKDNIDGVIYKECSLAFTYSLPECSICGRDIRNCDHEPFQTYRQRDRDVTCHYNYRQIERVLESSLVYRGAVPNTSVSPRLDASQRNLGSDETFPSFERLTPIDSLSILDASAQYVVVPRYQGIPVSLHVDDGQLSLTKLDGTPVEHPEVQDIAQCLPRKFEAGYARLLGSRGKERCSQDEIERYLEGRKSVVKRLVLVFYPDSSSSLVPMSNRADRKLVKVIPYRVCGGDEVHRRALEIQSRDGVEIWPVRQISSDNSGFLYRPQVEVTPANHYAILTDDQTGRSFLKLQDTKQATWFEIISFNADLFNQDRRFVTRLLDRLPCVNVPTLRELLAGSLNDRWQLAENAIAMKLPGLRAAVVMRPIILNSEENYLLFRTQLSCGS